MTIDQLVVEDDRVVSLSYVLRLENDEMFEHSETEEPLKFVQGHGQIIPGLESALYGMRVGDKKSIVVGPDEGYGDYDEGNFDVMSRSAFPAELELTVGMGLRLRDGNSGETYTAFVAELSDDKVLLDFNHPLAGETLFFEVQILGIRMATEEELA